MATAGVLPSRSVTTCTGNASANSVSQLALARIKRNGDFRHVPAASGPKEEWIVALDFSECLLYCEWGFVNGKLSLEHGPFIKEPIRSNFIKAGFCAGFHAGMVSDLDVLRLGEGRDTVENGSFSEV